MALCNQWWRWDDIHYTANRQSPFIMHVKQITRYFCSAWQSVPHLSPDTNGVPDVVLAVGQLPDAVVDGDAALSRSQVLLGHLHPSQRAHCKTLNTHTFTQTSISTHSLEFSKRSQEKAPAHCLTLNLVNTQMDFALLFFEVISSQTSNCSCVTLKMGGGVGGNRGGQQSMLGTKTEPGGERGHPSVPV